MSHHSIFSEQWNGSCHVFFFFFPPASLDSPPGNNVIRTIHDVGEMMTQMVLSRGPILSQNLPDTPNSLLHNVPSCLPDSENVTVMDTKLKIIEILQVSAPYRWTGVISMPYI